MNSTEKKSILLRLFFLTTISILFINMSGGGSAQRGLEPEFVKLKEGEGEYSGKIYDDKTVTDVREISFTGHTTIGGVRKEDDDSVNILDLAIVNELVVKDSNYLSKRFSDKEFILVKVVFSKDNNAEEFLVPRHVVVCARSAKTGQKKAWFLYKVQKIAIDRTPKRIIIEEEQSEEKKGWFRRVTDALKP